MSPLDNNGSANLLVSSAEPQIPLVTGLLSYCVGTSAELMRSSRQCEVSVVHVRFVYFPGLNPTDKKKSQQTTTEKVFLWLQQEY